MPLRFADDIDLSEGGEDELQQLGERLGKTAADCEKKISSDNAVLSILLYGCGCTESWTPMVDLERRIKALRNKTNEYVWQQVNVLVGHQELFCQPSTVASYHG